MSHTDFKLIGIPLGDAFTIGAAVAKANKLMRDKGVEFLSELGGTGGEAAARGRFPIGKMIRPWTQVGYLFIHLRDSRLLTENYGLTHHYLALRDRV